MPLSQCHQGGRTVWPTRPSQVLIYQALGCKLPLFAHMPLTMDIKKAKISKRKHGDVVTVAYYKEHGFLPWALLQFSCFARLVNFR